MSGSKHQAKILLHKPKKDQRSPSGVSAADPSSHGGVGAGRGVSTASKTPLSEPSPPANQPIWYRFRTALTTLLVLNAVLVGYALARTSITPAGPSKEADALEKEERENEGKPKETASEKAEGVDRNREPSELPESKASKASEVSKSEVQKSSTTTIPTAHPPQPSVQLNEMPKPSNEEQQELYKWMLAEKRKVKPKTKAEKAQIDAEKGLLKDFLRGKGVLDF